MQTAAIVLLLLITFGAMCWLSLSAYTARTQRAQAVRLAEHHAQLASNWQQKAETARAYADSCEELMSGMVVPARANVRDYMPQHSDADPTAPTAGFMRLAFRAHCVFANRCPVVVMGWHDLLAAQVGPSQQFDMLCELYSRAIFECSFARHLDGVDPCTDVAVLEQMRAALGDAMALRVHNEVSELGVVLRHPKDAPATTH